MPRLSIVIPCLGGAAEFDGTLVSILQHRPADCEVLVVHTEPYDDPYDLTGEVQFIEAAGKSLVELINASVDLAQGEVLHIVGCGLEATERWTDAALAHFTDFDVAAVSPIVLAEDGQSIVATGLSWTLGGTRRVLNDARIASPGAGRLRAKILGPTLQAAFYRREVLAALGGLDASLGDELADVDLALAIQALGRMHLAEPGSRLKRGGQAPLAAARNDFAAGRASERLFWRYATSRGQAFAVGLHALGIAGQLLFRPSLAELAGRAIALCEIGALLRNEQRIAAADSHLAELAELRSAIRKLPKIPLAKALVERPQRRAA